MERVDWRHEEEEGSHELAAILHLQGNVLDQLSQTVSQKTGIVYMEWGKADSQEYVDT